MADIFKFPNDGFEVNIVRKKDIINTIYENITDNQIALAIITKLEKDAAEFINNGKWTSLPYIGNVRIPDETKLLNSEEYKELKAEAKEKLDSKQYLLFRKELAKEVASIAKDNRYTMYLASKLIKLNRKLYRKLIREKGIAYVKVYFRSLVGIECINPAEDNYGDK